MNILEKRLELYIAIIAITLLTFVPKISNAASFSFISNVFSSKNNTASLNQSVNYNDEVLSLQNNDFNSQNLGLLQATLNIDPNAARGGGDVNIIDDMALMAESGVSGTTLDIEKAEHAGKISVYEVRPGDSLSQIAEMFKVSVNTIRWGNDLSGDIKPGQVLVILPVSGLTHTVKNGGNIADVAKIYEADVTEIALFNGLSVDAVLKKGDKIIVPNVDPGHLKGSDSKNSKTLATGAKNSVTSSYFINPVPGGIITQAVHGYNGVDIASKYNTPVLAAAAGKVITSKQDGWNGGYGNYVVISHDNGTQTLYSHNSKNIVYVGQVVEKGEAIGYMGSTGRSTGNHLHFEVRGARNPLSDCSVGSICK